jgi:hypothetical protein
MIALRLTGVSLVSFAIFACSATAPTRGNLLQGTSSGGAGFGGAPVGGTGPGHGTAGNGFGVGAVSNSGGAPDLGPIMEMDPNAADCAAIANKGEQITVDIYVMFDQSLSMTCMIPAGGDRWTAVKTALQSFVMDPGAAGINVGIQYFGLAAGGGAGGLNSSCTAADYEKADVEIGPLPMNSMPIVNSLNAHMPATNTPTTPALAGAINHAIAWKNGHPGHSVVVVLVTDGQPNGCGMVADVAAAATAGTMATIPTYVIGVTSPGTACLLDQNPPNQADLDTVAQAGGTTSALIVDVTQNTAQQFVATMNQIRAKSQVPCQYALPKAPGGQMLDPGKVNVDYTPPGAAAPVTILGVTMATCDAVTGGWYYDNPAIPTKINLCPSTCQAVSMDAAGGQINISVGCATKRPA